MRIKQIRNAIKSKSYDGINAILDEEDFDIIGIPLPSKTDMSLLVFERQTKYFAVINPSQIPSEEATEIIKAMVKEWIPNEMDTPILSDEKKIPFAILDFIKVTYRIFSLLITKRRMLVSIAIKTS